MWHAESQNNRMYKAPCLCTAPRNSHVQQAWDWARLRTQLQHCCARWHPHHWLQDCADCRQHQLPAFKSWQPMLLPPPPPSHVRCGTAGSPNSSCACACAGCPAGTSGSSWSCTAAEQATARSAWQRWLPRRPRATTEQPAALPCPRALPPFSHCTSSRSLRSRPAAPATAHEGPTALPLSQAEQVL